jgi:HlyD family secretion protein
VKKFLLIGGGVIVLAVVVFAVLHSQRKQVARVDWQEVVRKRLVATVSASGTIHPQRAVDVSANVIGKVTELAVAEGDTVVQGDFLLRIDPAEFLADVRALEAAVRTARADLDLAGASAAKAQQDLARTEQLQAQDLSSQEQLEAAQTAAQIERARVTAARSRLLQVQANLEKARYDLAKVTVTAPMSGVITRLSVEEGENAIMGTLNNPGTVLLVISDLSVMEARVRVDETEVVKVALDQQAKIEIDAFPDTAFTGRVTEIGNSPIFASTGASQQAVDFEVKITLNEHIANIRPGLSAKAEIKVAERDSCVAVPLGAVVVRKWPPAQRPIAAPAGVAANADEVARTDREGVFLVQADSAKFQPVTLGIAGEDDFEAIAGLEVGQKVVTGPFRILRDLEHGDLVAQRKRPDAEDD